MQKYPLCNDCLKRFKKSGAICALPQNGTCFICQGLISRTGTLVESALPEAKKFEWGAFSISSSFPKKVFISEEEVADNLLPDGFISIKNSVNADLIGRVANATGGESNSREADAIFEFNFITGKAIAKPAPIFIFGHYIKLSRHHCQSRWHCSDCGGRGCGSCRGSGMNYPSVEDELGKVLVPAFGAASCSLHACGREDVDVRALGAGRPFVMELSSPKKRAVDLRAVEAHLAKNPHVRAMGLRMVRKHFLDAVCNSHFSKEYSALVSADRPLVAADIKRIGSLNGAMLSQQTPKRVLARRTDMERRRKIHSIRAEIAPHGKLRLFILAEAGTYIKELIHSDDGRTTPSISEILKCRAACDELDVTSIHDFFLETISD